MHDIEEEHVEHDHITIIIYRDLSGTSNGFGS